MDSRDETVRFLRTLFAVRNAYSPRSGGAARGMRLREPAMLMDAAPTVLDLLGLDIPAQMRGRAASGH